MILFISFHRKRGSHIKKLNYKGGDGNIIIINNTHPATTATINRP